MKRLDCSTWKVSVSLSSWFKDCLGVRDHTLTNWISSSCILNQYSKPSSLSSNGWKSCTPHSKAAAAELYIQSTAVEQGTVGNSYYTRDCTNKSWRVRPTSQRWGMGVHISWLIAWALASRDGLDSKPSEH